MKQLPAIFAVTCDVGLGFAGGFVAGLVVESGRGRVPEPADGERQK